MVIELASFFKVIKSSVLVIALLLCHRLSLCGNASEAEIGPLPPVNPNKGFEK